MLGASNGEVSVFLPSWGWKVFSGSVGHWTAGALRKGACGKVDEFVRDDVAHPATGGRLWGSGTVYPGERVGCWGCAAPDGVELVVGGESWTACRVLCGDYLRQFQG